MRICKYTYIMLTVRPVLARTVRFLGLVLVSRRVNHYVPEFSILRVDLFLRDHYLEMNFFLITTVPDSSMRKWYALKCRVF